MKRVLFILSVAAAALSMSVPASPQSKATSSRPQAPPPAGDDRLWSLTLTVKPDSARRAADDIVKFVKDPSAPAPTLLGNVLDIFSARLVSTTASEEAARTAAQRGPFANMAASACAAAIDSLGQQAGIVKQGYDTLASGLPADKVSALRQHVQAMADQLAAAARTAADRVRKDSPAPKAR